MAEAIEHSLLGVPDEPSIVNLFVPQNSPVSPVQHGTESPFCHTGHALSSDESMLLTIHAHEESGSGGGGSHIIATTQAGFDPNNVNLENVIFKKSIEYDSTKTHAPKYKYWVLRVPVSIPEYTS
jgi:hypothetical protein